MAFADAFLAGVISTVVAIYVLWVMFELGKMTAKRNKED